jgi:hypothetical protein
LNSVVSEVLDPKRQAINFAGCLVFVQVYQLESAFISLDFSLCFVYFRVNGAEVSIHLIVIVLAHHHMAIILLSAVFDSEVGLIKLVVLNRQIQQIPLLRQRRIFQAINLCGARNGEQFPFDAVIFLCQLINHSLSVQGLN